MKKSAPTTSSTTASSRARREASPMASMPTNTNPSATPAKQSTRSLMRSPSGSPLPTIVLDEYTIALIKENEQMLQTITVLQHELEKQEVRLSDTEAARLRLESEVAELRNALGLAASEASTSTGKVLNYKTEYLRIQDAYDKLKLDADATKNKLEEATRRERQLMQGTSSTARTESQRGEAIDVIAQSMKLPNTFLAAVQRIVEKMSDPAVRPADRRRKVLGDVERLEAKVADYWAPEKVPSSAVGGATQADLAIRKCIHGYMVVLVKLLKDDA